MRTAACLLDRCVQAKAFADAVNFPHTGVKDSTGTCCTTGLTKSYDSTTCCQAKDVYQRPAASKPACCDLGKPFKELKSSSGPDNCCYGSAVVCLAGSDTYTTPHSDLYKTSETTKNCCAGIGARIFDVSPSGFQSCCSQSGVLTGSGTDANPRECCYLPRFIDSNGVEQCCKFADRYDNYKCCPSSEGKKLVK